MVEDEAESRKKLDDQKKKIQKELRDIEKFSCVPKELQESIKSNLQQQLLQEVEQRRHDLMPEHQKVQKRQQKTQSIQDKRRNMQEESAAGQQEMQSIREEIDRKEERFRQLSDKVDKNKMVDAEMAAELQGLQAGEERRGSNASQPGDGCLEALWQQLIAFERMELRPLYKGSNVEWERHKGRCQEEKKKEAVKTNKSKTRPVSNGRCRVQAGVLKALQRVIWSLIFLGFGVHLAKAEEQGSQVKQRIEKDLGQMPRGVEVRWKRMHSCENWEWKWDARGSCKEQEEKRNSQGKDPRTFDEKMQGGDLSAPETNSEGEDPRTFEGSLERRRVQKKRKEKQWKKKKRTKEKK